MSAKTTELIRSSDMPHRDLPHCHDGDGTLDFTRVYGAETAGMATAVKFIHDDILPPGASIGYHTHGGDEEYYYILDGSGLMQLDDEEHRISTGDLAVVYPGGRHGLVNDTDRPLRIIVIGASSQEA